LGDVHSALVIFEAEDTSGHLPTVGQILQTLKRVKFEKTRAHLSKSEADRYAKRDELNRTTKKISSEDVKQIKDQWGLVPAWRINSDGSAGWNWGGIENCSKLGTTLIDKVRVDLYVRKSHLIAFEAYHNAQKKDDDFADVATALQAPAMEGYTLNESHYIRANDAARAQIKKQKQEYKFNGGYTASNRLITKSWLDQYKKSDHYKSCIARIQEAKGDLAEDLKTIIEGE
jgi:hypothetical protein